MEHPFFASAEAEAAASADPPFTSDREAEAAERKLRAQAHVVGLLNQTEAMLCGWILKHPREQIDALLNPLYELCDKD